jgi:multiple sugar transport system substrate-binding protein
MAFMMEAENYNPWLEAAQGYLTQTLNDYAKNPVWTADPKTTPYRETAARTLPASGIGPLSPKVAAALAEFVVVDMVARYCTGQEDLKTTMRTAEKQAQRIFRG